jgi:ATP-binding cassette, subfamily F, member 3
MSILIQAANVTYAHGGNQIFEDLSFVIQERERIALIGDNGSGKSTLFHLLTRALSPDSGEITHRRGLRIGHLHQQSNLDSGKTVREVIDLAAGNPEAIEYALMEIEDELKTPLDDRSMELLLDRHAGLVERLDTARGVDHEAKLAEVLGGLAFPPHRWDQRIGELSGGERKLVDVSRFLLDEPELLLLDEPDNHFDMEARVWLETWLTTRFRGATCLISHDRYMIDRVATSIHELEHGRLQQYPGNYSAYLEQKEARLERERELRELREREWLKLKASAEELTQWARQNPKFASRAENQRRKRDQERSRLDAEPMPVLSKRRISLAFNIERGGADVLVASHVSKRYGEKIVLRPFDLLVRHGERVGLTGPNGAGKTTLLQMMLGQELPTTGTIRTGAAITVGYYAQLHETLDPTMTPIEAVRRERPFTEQQALSFLVGMLFDRDDTMNRIGALSGGEQARLQLAIIMARGANLLMLDEPTNNLDLASVEIMEAALREFPGTIVTISHDRRFLDAVCTRILAIEDGVIRDYAGGYSSMRAHPETGTPLTRGMARGATAETGERDVRRRGNAAAGHSRSTR